MDCDQASRWLEKKFPGLKVHDFKDLGSDTDPKGNCVLDLEINGCIYVFEGHLQDFLKMDNLLVEKVELIFDAKKLTTENTASK